LLSAVVFGKPKVFFVQLEINTGASRYFEKVNVILTDSEKVLKTLEGEQL